MRLLKLTLRNFKGVRALTVEAPDGGDLAIYGDNATGKTTTFDAWLWLLFGKDSSGSADFALKTLGADGEPLHNLDHEVEATLERDGNGTIMAAGGHPELLVLRKVYRELYQRKRGSAEATFTGHTTDHFIDGVPTAKREYDEFVAGLAQSEQGFRVLTDPVHFAERLPWKERRRILLEVCGDLSDADVLAANPDLAGLSELLGRRSLEEHRRVIDARSREINTELERIPVRIDEANRGRVADDALAARDERTARQEVAQARAELERLLEERASLRAGGGGAGLLTRRAEIRAQLAACEERERAAGRAEHRAALEAIADDESAVRTARAELESANAALASSRSEAERLRRRREECVARWQAVNSEQVPEPKLQSTCAACGQALPAGDQERARAELLATFNRNKAKRLSDLDEEGKALRASLDGAAKREESAQDRVATAEAKLEEALFRLGSADTRRALAQDTLNSWTIQPDPQRAGLETELEGVVNDLVRFHESNAQRLADLDTAIEREGSLLADAQTWVARHEDARRADERIAELGRQEKLLAAEFEELQRQRWLTEEFIRRRVAMIEGSVNSQFRIARFQLFRTLVNGGLEECCEVLYNGVPYSSGLNHGARINVGLDIITTLQRALGASPPVWVDQCESITELLPMECQVVRLIVSAEHKALAVVPYRRT